MVWSVSFVLTVCSVQVYSSLKAAATLVPARYSAMKTVVSSIVTVVEHMTPASAAGSDQVRCVDVHLNDKHMQHPMLTVFGLLL